MHYILCTGSREFDNEELVRETVLKEMWAVREAGSNARFCVVVGNCPTGADSFVSALIGDPQTAFHEVTTLEEFKAYWDNHGKAAGPMRNKAMVDYIAASVQRGVDSAVCIAFFKEGAGNVGTSNCARLASAEGIPVVRRWA